MKKLLLLVLALVMTLTLVACGGETTSSEVTPTIEPTVETTPAVALEDVTTDKGVRLKLPSDMTLQDNTDKTYYANATTYDIAVITELDGGMGTYAEVTQEEYVAANLSGEIDLKVISYENNLKINGYDALLCKSSFATEDGDALTSAMVMITNGTREYGVLFMYPSDNTDSSLATNLQACIDSISIPTE